METQKRLKKFKENIEGAVYLIILIAIVAGALYVLLNASAADWRELYCQANPVNCIRKGW
jgi:hypothetical protein